MQPISKRVAIITALVVFAVLGATQAWSAPAKTVCFKYNMTVRAQQSISSAKVRTLPTTKVSGPVSNGWMRVRGGWVKLGPPNQVPCPASKTTPKKTTSSGVAVKKSVDNALAGVIAGIRRYARDVELSRSAMSQVYLVRYCEKHRSTFGWKKCYAVSTKLFVHASRLAATNTNADARVKARGYVSNFLSNDLRRQTRVRLDAVIDADLKGIPAGRWNSKELKRLEARAEALADNLQLKSLEAFVATGHPQLKVTADELRSQRPKFTSAVEPYKPMMGKCELSPLERQVVEGRIDALTLAKNALVCDMAPTKEFNSHIKGVEDNMPMKAEAFAKFEANLPAQAHALLSEASSRSAQMPIAVYAKNRGIDEYLEHFNLLSVWRSESDNPADPCATFKKKERIVVCQQAMVQLDNFGKIYQPALAVGHQHFASCPVSTSFDQVKACFDQSTAALRTEIIRLSTPSVGLISRIKPYLPHLLVVTAIMLYLFYRRSRRQSYTVREDDRPVTQPFSRGHL